MNVTPETCSLDTWKLLEMLATCNRKQPIKGCQGQRDAAKQPTALHLMEFLFSILL